MTILKAGTPIGFQDKDGAEATAVKDGCTPDEARMKLALQDAQDEDLADELRDRGYAGTITKTKTIII